MSVVIVGGGVVGLAIAWRTARAGLDVTLADPRPGRGTSWVAAGMLAPTAEVRYGEEHLLALTLASARAYPSFVEDLEAASGREVGYRASGTLIAGFDADDLVALDDIHDYRLSLGLEVERLSSRECRAREPRLAPLVRGATFVADDHQVDNRLLVEALIVACDRAGVAFRSSAVRALDVVDDRVRIVTFADGHEMTTSHVVLAAGASSTDIAGVPSALLPPVRPVKGEILRLRGPADAPLLSHVVRGLVRGGDIYLVPRSTGEVVVGATMLERGCDARVTAGGVHRILDDARRLVPDIDELELAEMLCGFRPATPDNAPVLGATAIEGLSVAYGHYRNGMLLAPVTASIISELLTDGDVPEIARPFSSDRFTPTALGGVG